MRAGIVTALLDPSFGGPATVVRDHAESLRRHIEVDVYGMKIPGGTTPRLSGTRLFAQGWPSRWFRMRGLTEALEEAASGWDVIHAHMLWDHPVWCCWKAARKHGRPLILTPHGSVSASWRWRSLHKRAYRRLILDRILDETACIQALSRHEEQKLREFGVRCPIRVIPNGLAREAFGRPCDAGPALSAWPELGNRRVLLFLGRLAAIKGLDLLADAWGKLGAERKDWLLVLAGPDHQGYEEHLRRKIAGLGDPPSILLTGAVSGRLKASLLAAAECFILPSLSEALSMSLLEAMAAGLPAVYTTGCNFPELALAGGGWETDASVPALVECLRFALGRDPGELRQAGLRGCALGLRAYTLEHVAGSLLALYRTVAGVGEPAVPETGSEVAPCVED